jgi:DNA (cytosine-5)-methyltransferase 1
VNGPCSAGGSSRGFQDAGFCVIGVDNQPQPHYIGDAFYQMDALEFMTTMWRDEYACVAASPPCQPFSTLRHMPNYLAQYTDMIGATRAALQSTGKPYIIENVRGAASSGSLRANVMLCGTMFGLGCAGAELWRHRYFETNWDVGPVPPCHHTASKKMVGVYGGFGKDQRRVITVVGHAGGRSVRDGCQQFNVEQRREAMGIDWMTNRELAQAIPPAYTRWLGERLMAHLREKGLV